MVELVKLHIPLVDFLFTHDYGPQNPKPPKELGKKHEVSKE